MGPGRRFEISDSIELCIVELMRVDFMISGVNVVVEKSSNIGLDKHNFWVLNFEYFLIHQTEFEHMFWVLKRTVSLRNYSIWPLTLTFGSISHKILPSTIYICPMHLQILKLLRPTL